MPTPKPLSREDETRRALLDGAPPNQWIALSADESRIVASAASFTEAVEAAEAAGESDPLLVHVPEDWSPRVLAA